MEKYILEEEYVAGLENEISELSYQNSCLQETIKKLEKVITGITSEAAYWNERAGKAETRLAEIEEQR